MRDAVGGPGAVVVHFGDAAFAGFAVVGAGRFGGIAFPTPFSGSWWDFLQFFIGYCCFLLRGPVFGDGAWIHKDASGVGNEDENEDDVGEDEFVLCQGTRLETH